MGDRLNLSVVARVYEDGCVIMEGYYQRDFIHIDYYERYAKGTPPSRCLRALASWCATVEAGERDSESLWVELQLPFDPDPDT